MLACVEPLTAVPGVSVTVVDNASDDGTIDVLHEAPVRVLALEENRGFAAGTNAGWRLGSAPYVLLLNPDARMDSESLARLVDVLEREPSVGAVAPLIHGGDGSIDFSQRRFPRARSTLATAVFLQRLLPEASWTDEVIRNRAAYDRLGSPDWVSGACMLVRRPLLEQLGGLDERFFLYCEDMDLCRRIRLVGYDVRFEPTARAVHEGGASAPRGNLFPVLARSRIRYARKHRSRIAGLLERVGIALGSATHVVVCRGGWRPRMGHARSLLVALSPREPAQPTR